MQKITPCLWFDDQAEEAVNFYASIFKDVKVGRIARYDEAGQRVSGRPKGSVMTIEFELFGQQFLALNGGPIFRFTEAISLIVNCESQAEVDHYWEKLTAGGEAQAQQCGWLKDKFGLSWQIVPTALTQMLSSGDAVRSQRVMQAVLKMKKLDIAALKKAYEED
jgi:predicted 3-demethylubiquinone-9 3-methyltransferase (glyoxalase superfamily)